MILWSLLLQSQQVITRALRCPDPPKDLTPKDGNRKEARKSFVQMQSAARTIWGELPKGTILRLKELSHKYRLSVSSGDLQLLDGRWYVTHSGLLAIAQRCRCSAITTAIDHFCSDAASNRWVFKARVFKANGKKAFAGYGDANPSNVSSLSPRSRRCVSPPIFFFFFFFFFFFLAKLVSEL